jgi:hypothetical protein
MAGGRFKKVSRKSRHERLCSRRNLKRSLESTTSGGLIVLRLTPLSIGQEDRQLDVCWLELRRKIIVDIAERAIDLVHAELQQCTGLERHVTKPVVVSEMTVAVAPPFSWSVR